MSNPFSHDHHNHHHAEDSDENPDFQGEAPSIRSLSSALALSFTMLKVFMGVLVVFFLLNSITVIDQGQVGLVRRFGRYIREGEGLSAKVREYPPGLVFIWPNPIETLERVPVGQERELRIDQEFWPKIAEKDSFSQEDGELPTTETLDPTKDNYALTGGLNIIHVQATIRYQIVDAERHQLVGIEPEKLLRREAQNVILKAVAGKSVDAALYRDVREIQDTIDEQLKNAMKDELGNFKFGIEVAKVTEFRPLATGRTQPAFRAANEALTEKNTRLDSARAEAQKIVQTAQAEAAKIIVDAEAQANRQISRADSDAKVMVELQAQLSNPEDKAVYLDLYRARVIQEALESTNRYILPKGETWFKTGPSPEEFLVDTIRGSTQNPR